MWFITDTGNKKELIIWKVKLLSKGPVFYRVELVRPVYDYVGSAQEGDDLPVMKSNFAMTNREALKLLFDKS